MGSTVYVQREAQQRRLSRITSRYVDYASLCYDDHHTFDAIWNGSQGAEYLHGKSVQIENEQPKL